MSIEINPCQRRIILITIGALVCALLFPPFSLIRNKGIVFNLGYSWIFVPPVSRGTVNVSLLSIEIIVILIVAALGFVVCQSSSTVSHPYAPSPSDEIDLASVDKMEREPPHEGSEPLVIERTPTRPSRFNSWSSSTPSLGAWDRPQSQDRKSGSVGQDVLATQTKHVTRKQILHLYCGLLVNCAANAGGLTTKILGE